MTAPFLTTRLDELEANLPTIPARWLHLQRTLAGAAYDTTNAALTVFARIAKRFLTTARNSGATVTGQARAAGEDVLTTARSGAGKVATEAQSAAGDVARSARTGARTVRGQAGAQGQRVARAANSAATEVLDTAIDAVEADQPGRGTPYEQWTKAQLLERAQELDIEGRARLNKSDLITALRSA